MQKATTITVMVGPAGHRIPHEVTYTPKHPGVDVATLIRDYYTKCAAYEDTAFATPEERQAAFDRLTEIKRGIKSLVEVWD